MDNNLTPFNFEDRPVRVIVRNGEPWFVLADVCRVLEIGNSRDAAARLDGDEKADVDITDTSSNGTTQRRGMSIINESGLYSLILTSRKEAAKRFKKWVTAEVLPTIRKTGRYDAAPAQHQIPKTYAEALRLAAQQAEELEKAQAKIAAAAPKVEFFDAVSNAVNCQTVEEVAKALGTGQNRMFKFLRDEGLLKANNLPYQQYIDAGHFRVVERQYNDARGESHVYQRTLVTGKGMTYIEKRFNAGRLH